MYIDHKARIFLTIFFARIDQQAEIFHSSRSKQDSTKETTKKQKQKTKHIS